MKKPSPIDLKCYIVMGNGKITIQDNTTQAGRELDGKG